MEKMRMSKLKSAAMVLIVLAVFATLGCPLPFLGKGGAGQGPTGTLVLVIEDMQVGARTILPTPTAVAKVSVLLTRQGHNNIARESTSGSVQIENVASGTWTLLVRGYDGANKLIGEHGPGPVEIADGQTSNLTLVLQPKTSGSGRLKLSYTWNASPVVDGASFVLTTRSRRAMAETGYPTLSWPNGATLVDLENRSASVDCSLPSTPEDPYVVILRLWKQVGEEQVEYLPIEELAYVFDNLVSEALPYALTDRELQDVPAAPTNLVVALPEPGRFRLDWTDASSTETGFRVYRDGALVADLPRFSESWTDAEVPDGAEKTRYEVFSYNRFGNSSTAASQEVKRVQSITLPASLEMGQGSILRIPVVFAPADADFRSLGWSSGNATILAVESGELLRALRPGSITVTATSLDGAKTATTTVTILANSHTGTVSFPLGGQPADSFSPAIPVLKSAVGAGDVLTVSTSGQFIRHVWEQRGPYDDQPSGEFSVCEEAVGGSFSLVSAGMSPGKYDIRVRATRPDGTEVIHTFAVRLDGRTAEAIVVDEAAWLADTWGGLPVASEKVSTHLDLPTRGSGGSIILWQSSDPFLLGNDGLVRRPEASGNDASLELTAIIRLPGAEPGTWVTQTETFPLIIAKQEVTEQARLLADQAGLTIGYAEGDDQGSVQGNMFLPRAGASGATVSWTVTPAGLVSPAGMTSRPTHDTRVNLLAELRLGNLVAYKNFTVLVKAKSADPAVRVNEDSFFAEPLFGTGDGFGGVYQDITLPIRGPNGSTVVWSAAPSGIIGTGSTDRGRVTRPEADTEVTLSSEVEVNGEVVTRTFTVVVKGREQSNDQKVAAVRAVLEPGYGPGDEASTVKGNLDLPATDEFGYGSVISWSASPGGVITTTGDDRGTVARPVGWQDVVVTLTATITLGDPAVTLHRTYQLTVKATNDQASLQEELAQLDIEFADGDSAGGITQGFNLPSTGGNGTPLTWTTNMDPGVLALGSPSGGHVPVTVNQPDFSGDPDPEGWLKATGTKGNVTETTTVGVKVKKKDPTPAQAAAEDAEPGTVISGTTFSPGDDPGNVTGGFTLPGSGPNGGIYTWDPIPVNPWICYHPGFGNLPRFEFEPPAAEPIRVVIYNPPEEDEDITITGTVNPPSGPSDPKPTTMTVKVKGKGSGGGTATGSVNVTVSFVTPTQPAFDLDTAGMTIDQLTLNKSSSPAQTLTIHVGGSFDAYAWYLDAVPPLGRVGSGSAYTISSAELSVAAHVLTLVTEKNGLKYSATVNFRVVEE
jgi:hypothetical protein